MRIYFEQEQSFKKIVLLSSHEFLITFLQVLHVQNKCSIHIILQSMKRVYSFIIFVHTCQVSTFKKINKFDSLIIKTCFTYYLHVAKVSSHTKHHKDLTLPLHRRRRELSSNIHSKINLQVCTVYLALFINNITPASLTTGITKP